MKRFDIVARLGHDYHGPYAFSAEIPDKEGPYVLHSEAQAEIERLRGLVREAYNEGFSTANGPAMYLHDDFWDISDAKKQLGDKP